MVKSLLLIISVCFSLSMHSQTASEENRLIDEGIALSNQGKYKASINKYNQVLKLNKNNVYAHAEKAYSLLLSHQEKKAIDLCKKTIKKYPDSKALKIVYTTYGNALDQTKKSKKAISVYNQGIRKFPNSHMLHFNKGITLVSLKENDQALNSFQKALLANPNHPGSHNAIGRLSFQKKENILAILALSRCLILESRGKRAIQNLELIQRITNGSIKKGQGKDVNLNLSLDDLTPANSNKKNNFKDTNLILMLASSLDYDDTHKNESNIEKFKRKMIVVYNSLSELQHKNTGFYWDTYATYFISLYKNNHIDAFSHHIFSNTNDTTIKSWISKNSDKIEAFKKWSSDYKWK